jgi:tetratricopeptide (TPR) repeat protein
VAELAYLRGDTAAYKSACQTLAKAKPPFRQRSMTQIGYALQHDFHWDPYLNDEFDNSFGTQSRALDLPDQAAKQKSFSSRGKLGDRLASADQALANYPNDFYVLRQAALLNLAMGEYGTAAEQFDKAIAMCGNDHVDYLYMGRALFLAGKKPEAAQCISQFQKNINQTIAPELAAIAKAAPLPPPQAVQTTTPTTPVDTGTGF